MRHVYLILILAGFSCDAQEPGGGNQTLPDAGGADAEVGGEVTFRIEGLPPRSYWDSVPIFGSGPTNGSIIVEGNIGTVSVEAASDGSFCIDVPLAKGEINTFLMSAINSGGERSETQMYQLSQEGEPPPPGTPLPSENIALGGLPTTWSTATEKEGTFDALTDGVLTSSVLVKNDRFADDYLVLRMPVADGVERIRVYSDLVCDMSDYLLHTAKTISPDQQIKPGAEELDSAPWTFHGHSGSENSADVNVVDCSDSEYSCQEFSFESSVVKFVGLRFLNAPCSSFFVGERRIHEIEVWTPEGPAPPVVVAPTCQGG